MKKKKKEKNNLILLYSQNKLPWFPLKPYFKKKNNFNIPIQGNGLFHFVTLSFYVSILSI